MNGEGLSRVAHGVVRVARGREAGISASITPESLTCVGKTESLRNQDARPRGSQGMSGKVF